MSSRILASLYCVLVLSACSKKDVTAPQAVDQKQSVPAVKARREIADYRLDERDPKHIMAINWDGDGVRLIGAAPISETVYSYRSLDLRTLQPLSSAECDTYVHNRQSNGSKTILFTVGPAAYREAFSGIDKDVSWMRERYVFSMTKGDAGSLVSVFLGSLTWRVQSLENLPTLPSALVKRINDEGTPFACRFYEEGTILTRDPFDFFTPFTWKLPSASHPGDLKTYLEEVYLRTSGYYVVSQHPEYKRAESFMRGIATNGKPVGLSKDEDSLFAAMTEAGRKLFLERFHYAGNRSDDVTPMPKYTLLADGVLYVALKVRKADGGQSTLAYVPFRNGEITLFLREYALSAVAYNIHSAYVRKHAEEIFNRSTSERVKEANLREFAKLSVTSLFGEAYDGVLSLPAVEYGKELSGAEDAFPVPVLGTISVTQAAGKRNARYFIFNDDVPLVP